MGEDAINNSQLFNTGAYPVLLPGNGIIYGERYRVPKATLLQLDYLEGYPSLFHQSWMQLMSGDWAWVYQGNPQIAEGSPSIQSGRWRDQFENANAEASSVIWLREALSRALTKNLQDEFKRLDFSL